MLLLLLPPSFISLPRILPRVNDGITQIPLLSYVTAAGDAAAATKQGPFFSAGHHSGKKVQHLPRRPFPLWISINEFENYIG